MQDSFKRLAFALLLIGAAAAVLLWSDRHSRQPGQPGPQAIASRIPVALLQHSSNPLLDETRQGVLDGLAEHGYRDGARIAITTYNPEGDLPTGNLMAQKIAGGGYRLALSISTVMLQALANANKAGRVPHVFGAVTSPVAAGVGVKALDGLDKPGHLTGIATPQPVAEIFRLAKQINPGLKTVGVVWNPAEVNSEVCTKAARAVAAELGLTLLEAPVEQTKDVREAAESLVARGAEAFWTGGDVTVNNAVDSLIGVARAAHIPVFSNIAGHAKRGGLFDLGANYHEVGREIGRIAADVLAGTDPAKLPVRTFMPDRIILNEQARQALRDGWRFDDALQAKAAEVIQADGSSRSQPRPGTGVPALDHAWKLKRLLYVESPPAEDALRGMDDGFKAAGLVAGRDYTLTEASAQGDMATLQTMADGVGGDATELLITLSTPTLQTVLNKVKHLPIVFTFVADPFVAGAGTDDAHHRPNVTGVYTLGPYTEMADLLARHFPQWRRIGTLFSPAEVNSVRNKEVFVAEAAKHGLEVSVLPVNSSAELADAALALASQPIDAIVQIPDNQTVAGFTAIAQAATRAKKPLFAFTDAAVKQGAALGYTLDYYQAGQDAAHKAAEIMRGKSPGEIPFSRPSRISLIVSEDNARAVGLELPPAVLAKADRRIAK
ncbi:ABC transporter substrate-binding protein [Methylomagnum sp.]